MFWDTGGTDKTNFSWLGVWLSWGKSVQDLSWFWGLNEAGQSFDKFGKSAEAMEASTPWFLAKRNDSYVLELAKRDNNFLDMDEFGQKEQIKNLLQERDTQWELFSGWRWAIDVQNTVDRIYARVWQRETADPREWLVDAAGKAFDRDIADIESQYKAETDKFMRAWAAEDRFSKLCVRF
jgi:hypothetical protein